jgi:ABC-type multidrug transport system fused ATPase/permease subunit
MWEKQNDILKAIGDRIKKDLVEYITNNTSMQIYGLADTYDQVLHQHLSNYNNNQIQDSILYGIFMFMFLFIMRSIDIGVYLLNNDMNSNSFFEIQITVNYFRLLSESIQSLSDIQKELKRNKSSISRLLKYMNTDHNAKMDTCNNNNINSGFKIEIKNLTFGYPTRLDLIYDNYSVTIDEGSIFYLKGHSGTGKTTLIKLLLGLYRPNKGEILIGKKSTYFMSNNELRQLITIIPQEPVIFENKTLRENLNLFSRKTKTKKLKKILKVVKLSNLIPLLDKPLIQLSGGQKQRLSIARIFLNKKVPIVILDEAFSAMDSNLRKSMQKLVYNYIKRHGKTLIIVQHE